MAVAPLLAPGGVEMRVVSRVAAFTWGSWHVEWPEDFDAPDPPAEDRELGWVADLGGVEVEPFGRCFVRADAQIDATLGRSSVEDVLDAAKYRTSGEVFLETEIPFENLAGQLPYRDFDVNSLVPTRVGGRILENQLVTKVVESEDEQGHRTASVYIGGQKFQDREALRTANREIDRVIAQERLERGDEIGAKLAASQEYEREQRKDLKKYVDRRDGEVEEHADTAAGTAETNAKAHAEEEDRKLKRGVDLIIGENGSLTRQVETLNKDYTAKLGANGTVIADQAAHQRMLEGIVYGKPVSELTGTAFAKQQQAVNEMNAAFQGKQTSINAGFDYLFGLNEKINLAQDYTVAYHRILARASEAHRFKVTCNLSATKWGFEGKIDTGTAGYKNLSDLFDGRMEYRGASLLLDLRQKRRGLASIFSVSNFSIGIQRETGSYSYGIVNEGICIGSSVRWDSWDRIDFEVGAGSWELPKDKKIYISMSGIGFFSGLTALYREELDALDAEYRAKGLRV